MSVTASLFSQENKRRLLDRIDTNYEKWIFYDNTIHKRECLGKDQQPSADSKTNNHIKMLFIKDPLLQNAREGGLSRD